ncbi:helix-turn-helix domain-containing protein [Tenacibaculum maritimum]|nr:helix-turn-helix domain-containing protein [Tenacibaculum maritimum]MDB0603092.1 helix-turn-helix domain-containing protein [Tenacibaculum maritimum]MDB0611662.1 helix-turn-helix domain-containing protein [Tenacibaculum maritimum]
MSSNIRIEKKCFFCGATFIARTTVTKHCSNLCAKRAYKARKRQEKIDKVTQTVKEEDFSPTIKDKEFLSIKESSLLLGVSRWTIYRLIEKELLNSKKIGRRVIIKKIDIEKLMS